MNKLLLLITLIYTAWLAHAQDSATNSQEYYWEQIGSTYTKWMKAWVNKDINEYLSAYSPNFVPDDGRDHVQWREHRYKHLKKPGKIKIDVKKLRMTSFIADEILITFEQTYKSRSYTDTVLKQVIFAKLKGEWKIISEKQLDL